MLLQRYAIVSIFALLVAAAAYAAPSASSATSETTQQNNPTSKNVRLQTASGNIDANGDGDITKNEAALHANARFAKMDVDGNGKVDAGDRQARAKARFANMDADRNGALTEAEFVSFTDAKAAQRKSKRTATNKRSGGANEVSSKTGTNAGKWGRADTNNDNAISRSEYDAATMARFSTRDKDGNGVLSGDEIKVVRKNTRGQYGKIGKG